jgi:PBP1b-binding outer membrane lipoprotein LpoB
MKRLLAMVFVVALVVSGCATFDKWMGKEEEKPKPKFETPNQVFYTFPDIPIPKELNLIKDRTFIYETQNLKVGVLVLEGNLEMESLESYFKINMGKNGWKFVNSFKFRDVVLNFAKEDKTANIKMSRPGFSTEVEIWVGPSDKVSVQRPNEPR